MTPIGPEATNVCRLLLVKFSSARSQLCVLHVISKGSKVARYFCSSLIFVAMVLIMDY